MSYMILNPKTKKQVMMIKQFAQRMKLEFKQVSLEEYIHDITESRRQIKIGKKRFH